MIRSKRWSIITWTKLLDFVVQHIGLEQPWVLKTTSSTKI